MKKVFLSFLVLGVACGGESTTEPTSAQPGAGSAPSAAPTTPAAAQPAAAQPAAAQPAAAAAPTATAAAFSLTPGFLPDPHVVTGRAGGAVDASTLNDECRGYIAAQPNHVMTATAAFASIRLVVNGGETDTTLVVRKPDGTYWCDDDTEMFHPLLEGPAAAGVYQIYVGTYSAEAAGAAYRLGASEMTSTTAASLAGN